MRRRILHVAVVAVSVALLLFGVPLALVVRTMILTEEQGELERTALVASQQVGPDFLAGDPLELPSVESDKTVAVYDASLTRRTAPATGPPIADPVTRSAASGAQAGGQVAGDLVVAVPVSVAEKVIAVVRVSTPQRLVWRWVLLAWAVLALSAAAALVVAVLVARRQARLLSTPLEALAMAAERVGAGDLQIRAAPAGAPELVRLAQSQNEMLDRLSALIARERRFTADVSHQLRTPLTGLSLSLQNALRSRDAYPATDLRPALIDATDQVRDLERTIEDILRLARPESRAHTVGASQTVADLTAELERRWRGPLARAGRRLDITHETDPAQPLPVFVTTEVLKILLENATRHGTGRVTVSFRDLGTVVAIDVADEGSISRRADEVFRRGHSGSNGAGIGLALARSIAEAHGGRLTLTTPDPTRFTLLVPIPRRHPVAEPADPSRGVETPAHPSHPADI
ncbi:HAMP domain-containing sensor histidine kinase [Terrabacter sp. Ter38]|uniref:HAMP domain-containing sensor histidine kinase n=1 Tax=Terrabacter sp. Ter38 TaxID=2926030 RepID=UPI0021197082|nr:HAMP domain-containing sensor histidine kinase [Terrabacter sp. Ter38]